MRWYQCYISYLHAKVSNSYINLDNILGNYNVPDGWPGKVVKHGKGEVPGPPVWFEEESVQEAVAGVGYQSDNQRESDIFFYHTDHLQSTTYLTDSVGNVSQFVWYAPYGEALIDEHVGSYENPYKFSGKELDENTGLYDHGARHRDPSSGVWYGVDALFEKYPSCSPYAYCGGNPVRFVDMDGKEFTPDAEIWVQKLATEIEHSQEALENGSFIYNEVTAAKNEIKVLRESDIVIDVRTYSERALDGQVDFRGNVGYDQDANQFVIFINTYKDFKTQGGSELGTFAHELKHAYQFEIGNLTFRKTIRENNADDIPLGITKNAKYYDIIDEEEAHARGSVFGADGNYDRTVYDNLSKNPLKIDKLQYEGLLQRGKNILKDHIFHLPTQ